MTRRMASFLPYSKELPEFIVFSCISKFYLRKIGHVKVLVPLEGDVLLASGEIIAEQQVKASGHQLSVLGHDPYETARLGVHRRHPHHVRIVLAETFAAADAGLRAVERVDYLGLLAVGVGKIGLALALYLVERRLRDVHVALADERRHEAVEHREDEGSYLEAVNVGIGADDALAPGDCLYRSLKAPWCACP